MAHSNMEQLWQSAHLQGGNLSYVENLYEAYLLDPQSVPQEWLAFFESLPQHNGHLGAEPSYSALTKTFIDLGKQVGPSSTSADNVSLAHEKRQVSVQRLINNFRVRGHQMAAIDPLDCMKRTEVADLTLEFYGLSAEDLQTEFQLGSLLFGPHSAKLTDILIDLQRTYCSNIGFEYMHIIDSDIRSWFQQRIEPVHGLPEYSREVKKNILQSLTAAEGLEKYLGTKYPGTKRFGIEGGESLIPMIEEIIDRSAAYGAREIVMGMAHRGRLNVLVNIFGKSPADLFEEFEGKNKVTQGSGDVKYHMGFSSNWISPHGELHLALSFNPSHLEVVSPVVHGSVRARQERRGDSEQSRVLPIVVHGDAAFSGQGVVQEVFQMSQTRGYSVGGTIHIVLNNQIGFTTSAREDARSTEYCTDVAKMISAPIFHVNGDNPEAVLFVTQLAMDFRNEFRRDVVIDLVCYRRRGHNEADEPSATQPMMYKIIKQLPTTRELYAEKLVNEGIIDAENAAAMVDANRDALDSGSHVVEHWVNSPNFALYVDWTPYIGKEWTAAYDTRVEMSRLVALGNSVTTVPDDIQVQRQVAKIYKDRALMVNGELEVDWGCAESLAYATLLNGGHPVRLTGQDVGRGTFSHRHAVLHSQTDGTKYIPLQNIYKSQPHFDIYDSLLSEVGVLGFEYGYATTAPNSLVIWEAQFGDFANSAQVVIDQFITTGEHKWMRLCGLTMFLPHGYEGQGPEHSSARLERYLQLSAEHNIQVCLPTTPAQVFHMLRRQVIRPVRKPLIVMTAKSLLRHKHVVSSLIELADGTFHNVLDEIDDLDPEAVKRVVLCSGKIYYDLLHYRQENKLDDVAILRLEQLYPFPEDDLTEMLLQYSNLTELTWVQEEPLNQGAWYSSQHHIRRTIARHKNYITLGQVSREASAAPAAGTMSMHQEQQQKVVEEAFK